jgi:ribonuclease J
VIDAVDPDVLIPVHTENHGWFKEKWENTLLLHNGDTFFK